MLDASRMELLQYSSWATTLKEGSLWAKNDKRPIGRPYSLSSTVESITELFFLDRVCLVSQDFST